MCLSCLPVRVSSVGGGRLTRPVSPPSGAFFEVLTWEMFERNLGRPAERLAEKGTSSLEFFKEWKSVRSGIRVFY